MTGNAPRYQLILCAIGRCLLETHGMQGKNASKAMRPGTYYLPVNGHLLLQDIFQCFCGKQCFGPEIDKRNAIYKGIVERAFVRRPPQVMP
jgi:hypothetical protein